MTYNQKLFKRTLLLSEQIPVWSQSLQGENFSLCGKLRHPSCACESSPWHFWWLIPWWNRWRHPPLSIFSVHSGYLLQHLNLVIEIILIVCSNVNVPQLKLKFTQCWVRRLYVELFSHICMYAVTVTHHSGNCILTSETSIMEFIMSWRSLYWKERNMGLSTQQIFCFSPDILATANKMPILTISTASDQCQNSDSRKNSPSSTIPT